MGRWRFLVLALLLPASLTAQRVGSAACGKCHGEIAARYRKTPMGKSMAPANSVPVPVPAAVGNYRVFEKDSTLYQNSFRLDFAVGSGVNGQTFLLRRGNSLFEAPLTYYNKARKWGLSPGYEAADAGFSRAVPEGCIACHSASPSSNGQPSDGGDLAIGCENCHGPGKSHVDHPARGNIVNPARLDRRLSDDICMYCHQGGDARVLQPGKKYSDFQPGQPLNRTIAIFKKPGPNDSDLLEHHAAMRLSKCYRASGGKLSCLTCHDPHRDVDYNARCLECHTATVHKTLVGNDCVTCHMPKREVTQISHSALTNHRIIKMPGEALPPDSSSIYFNGEMKDLPALTKLAAFGELNMQREYLEVLDNLARTAPDEPLVRASLGRRALLLGNPAEAIPYLEGASTVTSLLDLGQALRLSGREAETVPVLRRAVELEPFNAVARKNLVLAYINVKDYTNARIELQKYVQDFPEDAFMRELLDKVSSR